MFPCNIFSYNQTEEGENILWGGQSMLNKALNKHLLRNNPSNMPWEDRGLETIFKPYPTTHQSVSAKPCNLPGPNLLSSFKTPCLCMDIVLKVF